MRLRLCKRLMRISGTRHRSYASLTLRNRHAALRQLCVFRESLHERTPLGCEAGLDSWTVVIKVFKYPLGVLVGFLKLFPFNFSPVVMQDVVSQDSNVLMCPLLPRFSDNFVPSCCVYTIDQP